uniref:Reverse transcriptase n=1 Tax=Trichogramma kaykai TaxID=54128 RepID=A0ABD2WTJ6_9HYME
MSYEKRHKQLVSTCHPAVEDVEHVIFHCPRFTVERDELYRLSNGLLEPKEFVGFILESERNWEATSSFASTVMTRLRSEEKARGR